MNQDKQLREFAEFFRNRGEVLFAVFGMEPVNLLNAAITATQQAAPSQRAGERTGPILGLLDSIAGLEAECDAGWSPDAKSHLRRIRVFANMMEASAQREQPAARDIEWVIAMAADAQRPALNPQTSAQSIVLGTVIDRGCITWDDVMAHSIPIGTRVYAVCSIKEQS